MILSHASATAIMTSLAMLLFASVPGSAAGQSFPADGGQITFNAPSGNIGCIYTPKGGTSVYEPEGGGPELSCDRVEPSYQRFVLGSVGKAKRYTDVGDASCCSIEPILKYGNTWSHDGFSCKSSQSGLTCNRGKNGFFISKSKTSVY